MTRRKKSYSSILFGVLDIHIHRRICCCCVVVATSITFNIVIIIKKKCEIKNSSHITPSHDLYTFMCRSPNERNVYFFFLHLTLSILQQYSNGRICMHASIYFAKRLVNYKLLALNARPIIVSRCIFCFGYDEYYAKCICRV